MKALYGLSPNFAPYIKPNSRELTAISSEIRGGNRSGLIRLILEIKFGDNPSETFRTIFEVLNFFCPSGGWNKRVD